MIVAPPLSLTPVYLVIVVTALLLAVLTVLAIGWLLPDQASVLIGVSMTGVAALTAQAMTFIKSSQAVEVAAKNGAQVEALHCSTNSGFERFAESIRKEAHAAGLKEAEDRQTDLDKVEARIAEAVRLAVAETQAAQTAQQRTSPDTSLRVPIEALTAAVESKENAPVDVQEISPGAAQAIADAASGKKEGPDGG